MYFAHASTEEPDVYSRKDPKGYIPVCTVDPSYGVFVSHVPFIITKMDD